MNKLTQCLRSTSSSASHFRVRNGRFLLMISPAKNVVKVGYSCESEQDRETVRFCLLWCSRPHSCCFVFSTLCKRKTVTPIANSMTVTHIVLYRRGTYESCTFNNHEQDFDWPQFHSMTDCDMDVKNAHLLEIAAAYQIKCYLST